MAAKKNASARRHQECELLSLYEPAAGHLSLRRPSVFGETIVFCAPARLMPLSTSPMIEKLIDRIDAARQER
jgi:hypothetical protein